MLMPVVVSNKAPELVDRGFPLGIAPFFHGKIPADFGRDNLGQPVNFGQNGFIRERSVQQLGRSAQKAIPEFRVRHKVGKQRRHLYALDVVALEQDGVVQGRLAQRGIQIIEHQPPEPVAFRGPAEAQIAVGDVGVGEEAFEKDPVDQAVYIHQGAEMRVILRVGHIMPGTVKKNILIELGITGGFRIHRGYRVLAYLGQIGIELFVEFFAEGIDAGIDTVDIDHTVAAA